MDTKKLFEKNNEELLKKLIPEKNEPIKGNLIDPKDPVFNLIYSDIVKRKVLEKIKELEFFTELEEIKTILKIT